MLACPVQARDQLRRVRRLSLAAAGLDQVNAFKIPTLWGVTDTAPYFHDNSASTLADVVEHYARFFAIISTPSGGAAPALVLSEQDKADIVAYMKLLR